MSSILPLIQHSYQIHISSKNEEGLIYVACSGGRDSMALLYACYLLKLPIKVIHINHNIQANSGDWQNFVKSYCQTLTIPYETTSLTWQNQSNVTINEQQARNARYHAMIKLTGKNAVLTLAHHANDQAETLLLNLCQGTGITGLAGMEEFSQQTEFGTPIFLWRPLLQVSRVQINQFIEQHKIPYIDDPTNYGEINQRAFLRNQVLPLLTKRFGKVIDNINRTQLNLREAKSIMEEQSQQDLLNCQLDNGWTDHQKRLDIKRLQKLPQARRFNLLHSWVKAEQKFAPNRQLIERIETLIFSQNSSQQAILYWQGIQIRRYRGLLYRLDEQYVRLLNQPIITAKIKLRFDLTLADRYKVNYRKVQPNESLQLLNSSYHQTFKKICQSYEIPSWERQFAQVIITQNQLSDEISEQKIGLLLPSQSLYLAEANTLKLPTYVQCPWQLDTNQLFHENSLTVSL